MVLIRGSDIARALVSAGVRTLPEIAGSAKVRGMNNAELIVATLKAAGIDHGFGIPSGNVLPLIEAMRQGGIEFVLTAHEGSAGFAADVMGRLTGRPGLGIATLGPGATNLATGVGDAFLDRSPMIAITCNLHRDQLGRRIQMLIDHHALFRPITKASLALRPGRIGETVAAAIRIALTEPQGPVHLDLPEDVALAPAEEGLPALDDVFRAGRPIAGLGGRRRRADRGSEAPRGGDRHDRDAAPRPRPAARRRGAAQSSVRHDDDGQGHDRRGSPARHRLHRARLPADPAALPRRRGPHRRARIRPDRSRVRGVDRRHAAGPSRHRAGGYRRVGRHRAPDGRRPRCDPGGTRCRRCGSSGCGRRCAARSPPPGRPRCRPDARRSPPASRRPVRTFTVLQQHRAGLVVDAHDAAARRPSRAPMRL